MTGFENRPCGRRLGLMLVVAAFTAAGSWAPVSAADMPATTTAPAARQTAEPAQPQPAVAIPRPAPRFVVVKRVVRPHVRRFVRHWRIASIQPRLPACTTLACLRIYPIIHGIGF
jgi:hypothetical protein